jgi:hypothetical protein
MIARGREMVFYLLPRAIPFRHDSTDGRIRPCSPSVMPLSQVIAFLAIPTRNARCDARSAGHPLTQDSALFVRVRRCVLAARRRRAPQ